MFRSFQKKLINQEFAIYGAGRVGTYIYRKLQEENLIPRCFLVTNQEAEVEIDHIPVLSIKQCENKTMPVIIGIFLEHQQELVENLMQHGYSDFVVYPLDYLL